MADDSCLAASERRLVNSKTELPKGVYIFEDGAQTDMMIVKRGATAGEPHEASSAAPATDPLIAARGWFNFLWQSEDAVALPEPKYGIGAELQRLQSEQYCTVRKRFFEDDCWHYSVKTSQPGSTDLRENELVEFVKSNYPADWIQVEPVPANQISATLTRAKIELGLTNTVFSYGATRTIFRPYQFRPLLRLLESEAGRLLIADEVGLGKTIEAGLIWTELDARNQADSVLVVCPSGLVQKWQQEMKERFDYEPQELDATRLNELLDRQRSGSSRDRFHGVCSLERLRIWSGLEEFADLYPSFDLIIVDEAHAFRNTGTRSNALGQLLSEWAESLLFLSATPLNLRNEDLRNLLELLSPGEFDNASVLEDLLATNAPLNRIAARLFDPAVANSDRLAELDRLKDLTFGPTVLQRPEAQELRALLEATQLTPADQVHIRKLISELHALSAVVTRTRKVDVQEDKVVREAHTIDVELTPAEWDFYTKFQTWQYERARQLDQPVGFATQMPMRLASSSIHAAAKRVRSGAWSVGRDNLDPVLEEGLDPGEPRADKWLEQDGPVIPPPEVVAAAKTLDEKDSKLQALIDRILPLVRARRRLIIFTFSRYALAHIVENLAPHMRVAEMHGDIQREDRWRIMSDFRNHEYDVLVASRVASEGLDFEFCSAIVNWDLPWNPMEIEQRIGRIDRFGQEEEKIAIFNLSTPGTVDTDILTRVHERLGVFKESIGDLEPVLQTHIGDIRKAAFDFTLTEEQRSERMNRTLAAIEEQRALANEVESAAPYLASTDEAEIEGLQSNIEQSGRYVGQRELVILLQEWCEGYPNAVCKIAEPRTMLRFRGVAAMQQDLALVRESGQRSHSEVAEVARWLRDETEVMICLNQDLARRNGQVLLSVNHALVRAALQSKRPQHRYASVQVEGENHGLYVVAMTTSSWTGVQPTTEIQTAAVDLESGLVSDHDIGSVVLTALAEGKLREGPTTTSDGVEEALDDALRSLRRWRETEQLKRVQRNDSIIDRRLLSVKESFEIKRRRIEQTIDTAKERERDPGVIRMNQGQLNRQSVRLAEKEREIEAKRAADLTMHPLAVLLVNVVP